MRTMRDRAPDLEAAIPSSFGDCAPRRGERTMLTVAYSGDQSDALKAHRQEVGYTAQGFRLGPVAAGLSASRRRTWR